MHALQLVEVAGLVAFNGPQFVAADSTSNAAYLEQYWATSKSRCDSWHRAMRCHAAVAPAADGTDDPRGAEIRAALDEIFASEVLMRVWTALLVARDRRLRTDLAEPIARNVFSAHLEARNRALALLLHGGGFSTEQAVATNGVRRRAERWSDMLVGGLLHLHDVREFAVQPRRAEDFAQDLALRRELPGGRQAWRLTLVSLQGAFRGLLSPLAANPQSNARIMASILGAFQGELFDSTGVFRSLWMMRLTANASDAQGLISDLLTCESGLDLKSATQPPRRRF